MGSTENLRLKYNVSICDSIGDFLAHEGISIISVCLLLTGWVNLKISERIGKFEKNK